MKPTAFDSLHPTIALGYFTVTLVLAMAAPHPLLLALSLAAALTCGAWLRGAGAVAKSLGWQLPLMLIIVAVNPLFSSTGTTELFRIGTQAVYAEGYANALTMAALLLCVMQWFSNANAVLGSDKVMGALGGILPTISLMVSMIMRLIPRFVKRGRTINAALAACTAARAKHSTAATSTVAQAGNNTAAHASNPSETISAPCAEGTRPTKRLTRVRFADQLRVSTTLMGWSMEDSLESADSMRCRGWGAVRKRTTFRRNRFRLRDAVAATVLAALAIAAAFAAYSLANGFGFFPAPHGTLASPVAALYAPVLAFPLLIELAGKVRR